MVDYHQLKNMATDKIQTGIRLSSEALDKIKYIAQRNLRSFNGQIEYLVFCCIEDYERVHGPIPKEFLPYTL